MTKLRKSFDSYFGSKREERIYPGVGDGKPRQNPFGNDDKGQLRVVTVSKPLEGLLDLGNFIFQCVVQPAIPNSVPEHHYSVGWTAVLLGVPVLEAD